MAIHLLLFAIAPALAGQSEVVDLDFQSISSLPSTIAPLGPQAARSTQMESEGLRVSLRANRDNLGPVAISTNFAVRGDFEITATYQILQNDIPQDGYGVGLALGIKTVSRHAHQARVGWLVRAKGKELAIWDRTEPKLDGSRKFTSGEEPNTARVGRLRFKRTGTTLQFLSAAGAKSEDFRAIKEIDFGSEDLENVSLIAMTGKQRCALEIRWLDLRIAADALPATAQRAEPHRAPFYFVIVLVGILIIPVAYLLRKHRKNVAALHMHSDSSQAAANGKTD